MKLPSPFYKLPLTLDVTRLQAEVQSLPADAWVNHPKAVPGNCAVRLITVDGEANDLFHGSMLPTPYLVNLPYIRQVLASFGVAWGRSRLMRLAPGAEVPAHSDINRHWFRRVRLHMPIITTPDVKFTCGDQTIHMAAGDVWVFDNWQTHRVVNPTPFERIHLVADTVGNSKFWRRVFQSAAEPSTFLPFRAGVEEPVLTERNPAYSLMSPIEVEMLLADLSDELVPVEATPEGSDAVAAYRTSLSDFVLDWRHCYLCHGDSSSQNDEFVTLREGLRGDSLRLGEGLAMRTNGVGAHDVLADRVLRQLLSVSGMVRSSTRAGTEGEPRRSARKQFFRPLFIVAAPRSGSTLLYETLAVNTSFCILGGRGPVARRRKPAAPSRRAGRRFEQTNWVQLHRRHRRAGCGIRAEASDVCDARAGRPWSPGIALAREDAKEFFADPFFRPRFSGRPIYFSVARSA